MMVNVKSTFLRYNKFKTMLPQVLNFEQGVYQCLLIYKSSLLHKLSLLKPSLHICVCTHLNVAVCLTTLDLVSKFNSYHSHKEVTKSHSHKEVKSQRYEVPSSFTKQGKKTRNSSTIERKDQPSGTPWKKVT